MTRVVVEILIMKRITGNLDRWAVLNSLVEKHYTTGRRITAKHKYGIQEGVAAIGLWDILTITAINVITPTAIPSNDLSLSVEAFHKFLGFV